MLRYVCNFGEICHVPQSYGSFFFSFRMLRHHGCLLARTNSSCLPFMHDCAEPTYRRKGKTDRGYVAFLFHTYPLTYSGSQVAHSAERIDFLISFSYHSHTLLRMVLIALPFLFLRNFSSPPCCMDPSDVDIVSYVCAWDCLFV